MPPARRLSVANAFQMVGCKVAGGGLAEQREELWSQQAIGLFSCFGHEYLA